MAVLLDKAPIHPSTIHPSINPSIISFLSLSLSLSLTIRGYQRYPPAATHLCMRVSLSVWHPREFGDERIFYTIFIFLKKGVMYINLGILKYLCVNFMFLFNYYFLQNYAICIVGITGHCSCLAHSNGSGSVFFNNIISSSLSFCYHLRQTISLSPVLCYISAFVQV